MTVKTKSYTKKQEPVKDQDLVKDNLPKNRNKDQDQDHEKKQRIKIKNKR